jgi:hypothetical protein
MIQMIYAVRGCQYQGDPSSHHNKSIEDGPGITSEISQAKANHPCCNFDGTYGKDNHCEGREFYVEFYVFVGLDCVNQFTYRCDSVCCNYDQHE